MIVFVLFVDFVVRGIVVHHEGHEGHEGWELARIAKPESQSGQSAFGQQ